MEQQIELTEKEQHSTNQNSKTAPKNMLRVTTYHSDYQRDIIMDVLIENNRVSIIETTYDEFFLKRLVKYVDTEVVSKENLEKFLKHLNYELRMNLHHEVYEIHFNLEFKFQLPYNLDYTNANQFKAIHNLFHFFTHTLDNEEIKPLTLCQRSSRTIAFKSLSTQKEFSHKLTLLKLIKDVEADSKDMNYFNNNVNYFYFWKQLQDFLKVIPIETFTITLDTKEYVINNFLYFSM